MNLEFILIAIKIWAGAHSCSSFNSFTYAPDHVDRYPLYAYGQIGFSFNRKFKFLNINPVNIGMARSRKKKYLLKLLREPFV